MLLRDPRVTIKLNVDALATGIKKMVVVEKKIQDHYKERMKQLK